jgi:hypothetical protein
MRIMDALGASMLPIIGILILQGLSTLPLIMCCAWPLLILLYLWMGYNIKVKGLELADSAVAGALTALAAGIIYVICTFLVSMFGSALVTSLGGIAGNGNLAVASMADAMTSSLITMVCAILLFPVVGAILAAIGYFIAGMMKK